MIFFTMTIFFFFQVQSKSWQGWWWGRWKIEDAERERSWGQYSSLVWKLQFKFFSFNFKPWPFCVFLKWYFSSIWFYTAQAYARDDRSYETSNATRGWQIMISRIHNSTTPTTATENWKKIDIFYTNKK